MGLLDILLGRTKPVQPDLDVLFTVPSVADTLQAALGFAPTGLGGVCFKAAEGSGAKRSQQDMLELLALDPSLAVSVTEDEFGFTWIVLRQSTVDVGSLVTGLHLVNGTLADAGFGPGLLCTVIGFASPTKQGTHRLGLVYLFKRGTFYPFAPEGERRRDTSLEMQARAELGDELPIEPDLQRWFPLWDAPVP
jgi:hypothetical protein